MSKIITVSFTLLLIMAVSTLASARFTTPEMIPVDRLVKNAEAFLAKHRNEADAYYTLARIHYLAFSSNKNHVPAYTTYPDGEERLIPSDRPVIDSLARPPKTPVAGLTNEQIIDHAMYAMKSFNEAIRIDPKNGLFHLGLASFFEEFWNWAGKEKPKSIPVPLQDISLRTARTTYWNAFTLAMVKDSKLKEQPISGIKEITAYEAASAFVRLSRNAKEPLAEQERKEVEEAQAAIANFQKLPPSSLITPIVFSFQPVDHLADLLDPDKMVDFDLRGYGPRETWPWVKPNLGFLVWDPDESGRIESARQMFGGYTFQIFWRTGYDALRALDDNDDGVLTGSELDGISVWFDRNGDEHAASDEVTPLKRLGIVSVSVTASEYDGIHPTNAQGIIFADGRKLRTWDWTVEPHTAEHLAAK
jgi:hypothetical protein